MKALVLVSLFLVGCTSISTNGPTDREVACSIELSSPQCVNGGTGRVVTF